MMLFCTSGQNLQRDLVVDLEQYQDICTTEFNLLLYHCNTGLDLLTRVEQ